MKPALLYGAGVWYGPQGTRQGQKGIDDKLEVAQNKFLRKTLGAYRAVNSRILEKEAETEPITVALEGLAAKVVRR